MTGRDALTESDLTLFSAHADPHLLVDTADGVVVDANAGVSDLVGYPRERLVDASIDLIVPDGGQYGAATTARRIEAVRSGGPQRFEWRIRTADGEDVPVELSVSLVELDGRECALAAVRDVSDRVRYQRELEEYRRRLDGAMFAGNLAWWEMDVETGEVLFHEQKADMLGYPVDAFDHYEDFTRLLHEADYERAMDAMADHLSGEAPRYDVEYRIETADGDYRWLHDVGGVTRRDADGNPVTVTGIVVDISERRETKAKLERKTRQLLLLNRIVRHDIRNDMSIVSGWLDVLREDVPPESHERIDRLIATVDHTIELTQSVRDLIDVIVAGKENLESHPVSLTRALTTELERARQSFGDATITLVGDLPDADVEANAMLSSVFGNLLNNAVQHNDTDHPHVAVTVEDRGETVEVAVADDGPGVPDELKGRLFSEGERGLESEGTGVGLYLVETLVTAFGGEVWITDNEPRGATFHVELRKVN
ncbi:MAG: PAS domain S-box protein [Salinigranum sp.]